jgi:hypothetical protein
VSNDWSFCGAGGGIGAGGVWCRGCRVGWGVADELRQGFPLAVMVECLGSEGRLAVAGGGVLAATVSAHESAAFPVHATGGLGDDGRAGPGRAASGVRACGRWRGLDCGLWLPVLARARGDPGGDGQQCAGCHSRRASAGCAGPRRRARGRRGFTGCRVDERVPETGTTTGCTSIISSSTNVMDKAGDNHGSAAIRAGEDARGGR